MTLKSFLIQVHEQLIFFFGVYLELITDYLPLWRIQNTLNARVALSQSGVDQSMTWMLKIAVASAAAAAAAPAAGAAACPLYKLIIHSFVADAASADAFFAAAANAVIVAMLV